MPIRSRLASGAILGALIGATALSVVMLLLLLLFAPSKNVTVWLFLMSSVPGGGLLGMALGIAQVLLDYSRRTEAGVVCLLGGSIIAWKFLWRAMMRAEHGLIIHGLPLVAAVCVIYYGLTLIGDRK